MFYFHSRISCDTGDDSTSIENNPTWWVQLHLGMHTKGKSGREIIHQIKTCLPSNIYSLFYVKIIG